VLAGKRVILSLILGVQISPNKKWPVYIIGEIAVLGHMHSYYFQLSLATYYD